MAGYASRCPSCGATGPEDAAWCGSCGRPLTGELVVLEQAGESDGPAGGAADDSSRRPHHRHLLIGAAALLVLGVLIGRVSRPEEARTTRSTSTTTTSVLAVSPPFTADPALTTTTAPPPFLDERTGTSLVLAPHDRVTMIDLDGNRVIHHGDLGVRAPSCPGGCLFPPPLARAGDRLVFQSEGATYAVPLDLSEPLSEPPRRLGDSLLFVPSWREGHVWLVERSPDQTAVVREVDVQGRTTAAPVPLPADWVPAAPVRGALVLVRGERFQVWEPGTNRVRFRSEPGTTWIAASGDLVAWSYYCGPPLCSVHLADLATGQDRAVPVGAFGGSRGAFSPDGRSLALFAQAEADSAETTLTVVDVATGGTTAADAPAPGDVVWSPSGDWLFVLLPRHATTAQIYAYRVGTRAGAPVRLPSGVSGSTLVAV